MSVELTESFIQFARGTYVGGTTVASYTAISTPLIRSVNAWSVKGSNTYGNSGGTSGFRIIADPVFPSRNRLALVAQAVNVSYGGQTMLSRASSYVGIRRVGFLLNIPPNGYISQFSFDSSAADYSDAAATATSVISALISLYKAANSTTLNLSHSATGAATALSYTLNTGTDYYIEVEINTSAGTYRVWVDDYLIIDASMSAAAKTALTAAWGFRLKKYAPGDGAILSDIYVLKDDGVSPSARLGKTTRVKGELPSDDVSVSFDRPTGFTSNYDVVNDGISSTGAPTSYLTGSGVGATDIYAVPLDTYAAQVYAVKVSAVAANFSSAAHRVDAVLKDGNGNTQALPMATLEAGAAFAPMQATFTVAPDGSALTPQNVASANFGYTIAT